jgi:hypothetical protein
METERLTRARDARVLRIITGVLFGDSLHEKAMSLTVYVKEFQGAIWDHASMRPDLGILIKSLRQVARAFVTIRQFGI